MQSPRKTQRRLPVPHKAKAPVEQKREKTSSKTSMKPYRVKTEPNASAPRNTDSDHNPNLYKFQRYPFSFFIATPVWPPSAIEMQNNQAKDTDGSVTTLATSKRATQETNKAEAKGSKKRKRPEPDSEEFDAGFAGDEEVSLNAIILFRSLTVLIRFTVLW